VGAAELPSANSSCRHSLGIGEESLGIGEDCNDGTEAPGT